MAQYLTTNAEIKEASNILFEKIKTGKVKVKIFKKYQLEDAIQAHTDLENRKIIGPAIFDPTK
jgi:NADPH2:quinone reductase